MSLCEFFRLPLRLPPAFTYILCVAEGVLNDDGKWTALKRLKTTNGKALREVGGLSGCRKQHYHFGAVVVWQRDRQWWWRVVKFVNERVHTSTRGPFPRCRSFKGALLLSHRVCRPLLVGVVEVIVIDDDSIRIKKKNGKIYNTDCRRFVWFWLSLARNCQNSKIYLRLLVGHIV